MGIRTHNLVISSPAVWPLDPFESQQPHPCLVTPDPKILIKDYPFDVGICVQNDPEMGQSDAESEF